MVAAIAFLLGLRLTDGVGWANLLQPHVAVLIAPLAYLGFRSLSEDDEQAWKTILLKHLVIVLLAQLAILLPLPLSADIILFAIASFYLVLTSSFLSLDQDAFVALPAAEFPAVRLGLYVVLSLLALMVASDLVIIAAILFAPEAQLLSFLSGAAGLLSAFVFVVALVGLPLLVRRSEVGEIGHVDHQGGAPRPSATPGDQELFSELTTLMEEKRLFTDSNLTLVRVARRLGVPSRDVSQAVNRCTGENFSRTVNGFRIRMAQEMLTETDLPITEVMLSCGFISKSSFNTEFKRVVGQTPSQFRATLS